MVFMWYCLFSANTTLELKKIIDIDLSSDDRLKLLASEIEGLKELLILKNQLIDTLIAKQKEMVNQSLVVSGRFNPLVSYFYSFFSVSDVKKFKITVIFMETRCT